MLMLKKESRFQNSFFKKLQVLHNSWGVHIPKELNKSISALQNAIPVYQGFSSVFPLSLL